MATATSAVGLASQRGIDGLAPLDLLNDLRTLRSFLLAALDSEDWTDAFLVAAGMWQILEDAAQPEVPVLHRGASVMRGSRSGGVRAGGAAAAAVSRSLGALRGVLPRWRAASRAAEAAGSLACALAPPVMADGPPGEDEARSARVLASRLVQGLDDVPATVLDEVVRLPSCFRSFDQHPDDVANLARRYAAAFDDAPVTVVGVRTAGSYLAPLLAAALAAQGLPAAAAVTLRPGWSMSRRTRALVRTRARDGGRVIVVDDPPVTGGTLTATVDDLVAVGLARTDVVLCLALFDVGCQVPERLDDLRAVTLPWRDWGIHRRLAVDEVARTLRTLSSGARGDLRVERRGGVMPTDRGHASAEFSVQWTDGADGHRHEVVRAMGVGLGYFGRHDLAVAEALGERSAPVIGLSDAVLFRRWLPDIHRLSRVRDLGPRVADAIAEYVVARRRIMAASRDRARAIPGRLPVWEAAAMITARPAGRLSRAAQVLVTAPIMSRLLRTEWPAVVDGAMELENWFLDTKGGASVAKVSVADRAFSNRDLACYDVVFDLACAGLESSSRDWEDRLRAGYESRTGEPVDGERWLLYQLVRLWDLGRRGRLAGGDERVASAHRVRRYLADVYLADVPVAQDGPLVALDVDGVLETGVHGFSIPTMATMRALRALRAHGFQTVVATGRSAADVRAICDALGFVGGVAEYGAAVYVPRSRVTRHLLDADARSRMDAVRRMLAAQEGCRLDRRFHDVVRARRAPGSAGEQWRLEAVVALRREVGDAVRAVEGQDQVDFVPMGVDKATGLSALLAELPGAQEPAPRCALAVGDTAEDLPLRRLAELFAAPRHAERGVRAVGDFRCRHRYQEGLEDAVAHLVGHRPGGCAACAVPELAARTRLLVALLSVAEAGVGFVPGRLARLRVQGREVATAP